jgi:hypothetical protein
MTSQWRCFWEYLIDQSSLGIANPDLMSSMVRPFAGCIFIAEMHMPFTFRAVLSTVLKDKGLSDGDRAHLYRWATLDYADDAIWKALAAAAHARGMLPPNTAYETIIREALLARRHAESVASGIDFDLRERQQYRKRQLQLAKYADDLADYYKWAEAYSGIAMYFMRFLGPVADLQEFHRKEALVLRQRAGREPRPAARVSRQDSSKAGRGLRKITAFIHMTNNFLTFWFSEQPDHEAIALLTEIAFPNDDVHPEDVRKALRPTTRAGRAAASRALKPK